MDFEKAYQETLVKWQRIAAGERADPSEDCGLCEWVKARQAIHIYRRCAACPAYYHYEGRQCARGTHIAEAIDAYESAIFAEGDFVEVNWATVQRLAQLVVEELLSIKDSLFKYAEALDKE